MKVAFISNYLSHHQIPFCKAMNNILGDDFCFISTMPMEQERINLGWQSNASYLFELKSYLTDSARKRAYEIANTYDVVIIGSASDSFIVKRLKNHKLTLKYSERFYKKGLSYRNYLRAYIGSWLHHGRFQKYPIYMLCASAYTPYDCARFGNYENRLYKWGYFPEARKYDDIEALISKKESMSLLWVGRMIDCKHPEAAVEIARKLKTDGYDFTLNMIGTGILENEIKTLIESYGLQKHVQMLGSMSPDSVRSYMERSEIFLFTSDFNEGWGAVLNEAMNSGCAVVASHAIGAVPYLIQDGKNGIIYENGNILDLYFKIKTILEYKSLVTLRINSYNTILGLWNAECAANRLINFTNELTVTRKCSKYDNGPLSIASILHNDWIYNRYM